MAERDAIANCVCGYGVTIFVFLFVLITWRSGLLASNRSILCFQRLAPAVFEEFSKNMPNDNTLHVLYSEHSEAAATATHESKSVRFNGHLSAPAPSQVLSQTDCHSDHHHHNSHDNNRGSALDMDFTERSLRRMLAQFGEVRVQCIFYVNRSFDSSCSLLPS